MPGDVLSIEQLGKKRVDSLLSAAKTVDGKRKTSLKGHTIVLLFFESSTRTRTSFEMAAKQLGADVVVVNADSMATVKGESLKDTVETLAAMKPSAIVLRHPLSGAAELAATFSSVPIINAGDGAHAHPTQAMLDLYTLKKKRLTLKGKELVICGDIVHSRVARSALVAFQQQGVNVTLCGPQNLLPRYVSEKNVNLSNDFDKALLKADILMLLRVQKERMKGPYLPSDKDYFHRFGLTQDRLASAKKNITIMHPGPIHRGVEIAGSVADNTESHVILDQVACGIAMRKAVLAEAIGVK